MSISAKEPCDSPNTTRQRPEKSYPGSNSYYDQAIYPTSGALTHLPLRTTISGQVAREHPNAHTIFLRNLPSHCYALPSVTLNFTIVELIVLLPNWFKNKAIAARFMNNHITAGLHFMILEEHRDLQLATEVEKHKARKTVADEYRRVMRKTFEGWTKLNHKAPLGWDENLMAMDGFVPDDVKMKGYRRPAPIPFCDLTVGVKKLPEGTHAGDLTRALQFALDHSSMTYMFPDDLPAILDHIGRTQITAAHTDRVIVGRYAKMKQKQDHAKKYPPHFYAARPTVDELISRIRASHGISYNNKKARIEARSSYQGEKHAVAAPVNTDGQSSHSYHDGHSKAEMQSKQGQTAPAARMVNEQPGLPPKDAVEAVRPHGIKRSYSEYTDDSSETMDALLRPHLRQEDNHLPNQPASPHHAPCQLLHDCVEGNVGFDGSPLANAARYAQRPDQIGTDWYVENVPWLAQLLNAAHPGGSGL